MTISSSLQTSVAGLTANATALTSISDNIANSSTFGYKRTMTDFHSMIIGSGPNDQYLAGSVTTSTSRYISEAGVLVSTTNPTDITVSGGGLIPVTEMSAVDAGTVPLPLSLMTTASFAPDADGVLTTSTGDVLLGWPVNADGSIDSYPRDTTTGLEAVNITYNQYAANPTENIAMAVNLPAASTEAGADGEPYETTIEYYNSLGQVETLTVTYTPTVPGTGASNEWTMSIADSATGGAVVAEYTLTFDDSAATGGTLLSVTDVSGNAYDSATGLIDLDVASATSSISLDIGTLGDAEGMTQLASSFAPTALSKDGSPVGNLIGAEIDEAGMVYAYYDTGYSRAIYQVPLADVPNVDGLIAQDNQTYRVSDESGAFWLWDAGDGPAGETIGYAREASTTDINVEMTNLITTQRAYASNAKVVQTVDEMLQEVTNIKR